MMRQAGLAGRTLATGKTTFRLTSQARHFAAFLRCRSIASSLTNHTMHIAFESPRQADAIALIAELDAFQDALYPPESRHQLDLTLVDEQGLLFVLARDADGVAVGCGALVTGPEYGEIKRVYVRPGQRKSGLASQIMHILEEAARASACLLLKLESGPYQPAALGLYERCGFERCGPFGDYTDDPLSVFMQKRLLPARA